jgi:hypothetical protein
MQRARTAPTPESTRDCAIADDATESSPGRNRDFALVIGIDHYPRFRSLNGAVSDAADFHRWVCDGDGGGVDPARARIVTSTPDPAAPIQDQIDEQLLELMTAADELGGGRRLYFYFSGHGATSVEGSGDDVALLLATWSRNLQRFALSSHSYSSELGNAGLFQELVIFLDCCRTVAVRAIGRPPGITYETISTPCATRCFVAYATETRRPAFEHRDEREHDRWQGVFTRTLLGILRRSPSGVDARALKDLLEREVREAHPGQHAHVINGLHDHARFGRRGVTPRLRITFGAMRGRAKLLDGRLELIAEHDATAEPWLISAPSGIYSLEVESRPPVLIDHRFVEVTDVCL